MESDKLRWVEQKQFSNTSGKAVFYDVWVILSVIKYNEQNPGLIGLSISSFNNYVDIYDK